jgi:NAD(P)-dependent dehydrogenase (short-subunit alcohol dehydrogenase family)/membrane protein DedA with SNARE-associated domain
MNVDAIIHHAGWFLFVWVFANQSGIPVPVVPSLVAAGALVGRGGPSCAVILAAAASGAVGADMVWYGLGRWRGAQALSLLGRLLHGPRTFADHVEHAFRAHEVGFQFWAQFLPELNPIAAGLAGATGVALGRYIVIASGTAMTWAGTWIALGYLLADVLGEAIAYLGVWIVVLVALAVVALVVVRFARRRRSRTELVKSAALVLVIAGALSGCGGAMSEVNALSVSKVNQEEDTMPVIAILGAGPGMGLAIAKTFGAHGYRVALLSRHPATQEPFVTELARHGIISAAFRADARDRESIASGLAAVKQRFGSIDVLEFSPFDRTLPMPSATELTHESVRVWIDLYVHGAVTAVNHVLPDMLARGSGTILFTTSASSVHPAPRFGAVGAAMAWLRNWAYALHAAVAPKGVQVGHVAIGAFVGRRPGAIRDEIASLYWELHTHRHEIEKVFLLDAADWLPEQTEPSRLAPKTKGVR